MGSSELIDTTKAYLSDTRNAIQLNDLVIKQLIVISNLLSEDNFAVDTAWSIEELTRRLKKYENIVNDLLRVSSLVAFWGTATHSVALRRALTGLTDPLAAKSKSSVWNELRWYPVLLLVYCTGISAVANEKYDNLASILLTRNEALRSYSDPAELVLAIGSHILNLNRQNIFKHLPGYENKLAARSEWLFNRLQPMLDDLLFLGSNYEHYFDRFEMLFALVYTDLAERYETRHSWNPIGRFPWKGGITDPMKELMDEADREKDSWGPIKAGLFSRDYSRFKDATSSVILPKLT